MRHLMLALLALGVAGCFRLDPFLYGPERTEAYEFDLEGNDPGEAITADRLEELRLVVNDQVTLGAVYVHANQSPPRAYALFFHGKGDHLGGQFERAKRLANLGYDVLAIDYRGFGVSSNVAPSEVGVAEDTAAALAYLKERAGGSDRIFYYGHSWGTAVATQRARVDPPRVLILESGFASIEQMKSDSSLLDFPDDYIADDGWPTTTWISELQDVPVLLMHGLEDDFVRPEFSDLLIASANDPKKLIKVPGADHGSIPRVMGEEFRAVVHQWVEQRIPAP